MENKKLIYPLAVAFSYLFLSVESLGQTTSVLPAVQINEEKNENSVDLEKIERKQDKNLSEVFKHSPEVTVGGNQSSNQKLYLRGLEENNLNITLDGARQNQNLFHHQGSLSIDPELLKVANVEAGTGGATSGPGALGGRVEFVTKDAKDFLGEDQAYGFLLKSEYSTNAEETRLSLAGFGRFDEKTDALIYLSGANYSNFKAGGGEVVDYTAGEPRSDLIKLNHYLSSRQKLTAVRSHRDDSALRYLRGNFGASGGTTVTDQRVLSDSYALAYDEKEGADGSPNSKSSHRKWNLHFATNDLISKSSTSKSHGAWENLGFDFMDKLNLVSGRWNYGFDVNQDKSIFIGSSKTKEVGLVTGLFIENGRVISGNHELALGLRGDHYQLKQTNGLHKSQARWSPSVVWSYRFDSHWLAQLSWKEAFKGVTPGEAFLLGGVKSIDDQKIEGSVAETSELKLQYQQNELEFYSSVYDTIIENPLFMKVARNTGVLSRMNGGPLRTQGLNLGSKYSFQGWNVRGSYSKNKMRYGSSPVGYTAFGVGSSYGARWTFGFEKSLYAANIQLFWDSIMTEKNTDVSSGQKAQPSYDVHDIGFIWQFSSHLKLSGVVRNLFDRKYIGQGSVYALNNEETTVYEPGRDLRTSLVYIY